MGDLLKYDPFGIGMDPSGVDGVQTTTHSLGVQMLIEAPPSVMDAPTTPPHRTRAVVRAVKKLPWYRRMFIGLCLRLADFFQKVSSSEPPRV